MMCENIARMSNKHGRVRAVWLIKHHECVFKQIAETGENLAEKWRNSSGNRAGSRE